MTMGILYDPRYLEHETGPHPESAGRLERTAALLEEKGATRSLVRIDPRAAAEDEVCAVHSPRYVRSVREFASRGGGHLDIDTVVSRRSFETALLAVGGAISACEAVLMGLRSAFALVRPPGHHAGKSSGMGFCIFNNVAVAARYLQRRHSLRRILVVDWDLHHGNGTEREFFGEEGVLYVSVHQRPAYPGTGAVTDAGSGAGEGFTVNVPVPAGTGDSGFEAAFQAIVEPVALEYRPEFVLVSAGQDGHFADAIGSLRVTARGYGRLAARMAAIAGECCDGRLVFCQEGGYHEVGQPYSVLAIVSEIAGLGIDATEPGLSPPAVETSVEESIAEASRVQSRFWRSLAGR